MLRCAQHDKRPGTAAENAFALPQTPAGKGATLPGPTRRGGCALLFAVWLVAFVWLTGRSALTEGRPGLEATMLAERFDAKLAAFQAAALRGPAELELTEDEINGKAAVELAYQTESVRPRRARVKLRSGEATVEVDLALGPLSASATVVGRMVVEEDGSARTKVDDVRLGGFLGLPGLSRVAASMLRERIDGQALSDAALRIEAIAIEPGRIIVRARPVQPRER